MVNKIELMLKNMEAGIECKGTTGLQWQNIINVMRIISVRTEAPLQKKSRKYFRVFHVMSWGKKREGDRKKDGTFE